jgi:hypothetical protein
MQRLHFERPPVRLQDAPMGKSGNRSIHRLGCFTFTAFSDTRNHPNGERQGCETGRERVVGERMDRPARLQPRAWDRHAGCSIADFDLGSVYTLRSDG